MRKLNQSSGDQEPHSLTGENVQNFFWVSTNPVRGNMNWKGKGKETNFNPSSQRTRPPGTTGQNEKTLRQCAKGNRGTYDKANLPMTHSALEKNKRTGGVTFRLTRTRSRWAEKPPPLQGRCRIEGNLQKPQAKTIQISGQRMAEEGPFAPSHRSKQREGKTFLPDPAGSGESANAH